MVYLRTTDPKYPEMLGQFIGVKGDITPDGQLNLKVITPTVTEAVDPATVNGSVSGKFPAEHGAKALTASAGGAEQAYRQSDNLNRSSMSKSSPSA